MKKNRSPLKRKPLRNPGQSIQERIDEVEIDRLLFPLVAALFLCLIAGLEWWQWATKAPPQPAVVTVFAALAIGLACRRFILVRRDMRRLRLGLDGEKVVAQYLEANRREDWRLLHDVPGAGFNVDHVLVTPKGVFAIETKTVSKPLRGDATVDFDGEKLLVNGRVPDRDPIVQARAARDWIMSILERTTGTRFSVRAVVLFPGWFVTRRDGARRSDVWILNEKALPAFIERESDVLKREDVALVFSRLEDHVLNWSH